MLTSGTFTVAAFEPVDYVSPIVTGLPVGHVHMIKEFTGAITGRSATQFSFAFDQTTGIGTYIAMEAFEGSIDGRPGHFAFAHSATTNGLSPERMAELLVIVPGSGTGELTGIVGNGRIVIDDAGVHTLELDYNLTSDGLA